MSIDEIKLNLPNTDRDPLLGIRDGLSMAEIDNRVTRYTLRLRELNPTENEGTEGIGYTPRLAKEMTAYRQKLYTANGLTTQGAPQERREAEQAALRAQREAAYEAELQQAGTETLDASRAELETAWLHQGGSKSSFTTWWKNTGESEVLAERAKAAVAKRRNTAARPGRDY